MALSGDLRQVRDAQHLAARRRARAAPGRRSRPRRRRCRQSTSSNTMQRAVSAAQDTCTASDRRASSPPEATLASARGGWPGLVLTRNSIRSMPCARGLGVLERGHVDQEAAAGHAELLHARRDVLGQGPRGRGAPRRELPRLLPGSLRARQLSCARSAPRSAAAVSSAASSAASASRRAPAAPRAAHAVLARQLLDRGQPALDGVGALRIEVERIAGSAAGCGRRPTRSSASSSSGATAHRARASSAGGAAQRRQRARQQCCAVGRLGFVQTLRAPLRTASSSRPRLARRACSSRELGQLAGRSPSASSSCTW